MPNNIKYKPDELLDKFTEYLEECSRETKFPNIAGFAVFAKMFRSTYYSYTHREEYKGTIEFIELALEDETIQCMVYNKNPAGAIFYAKNKLGYVDKKEIETTTTNNVVMLSTKEDLIAGILQLTSKLNQPTPIDVEAHEVKELEQVTDE